MKYRFSVSYVNKEGEDRILYFDTKKEAVAKAEYLIAQFGYEVNVYKELFGQRVEEIEVSVSL